MTVALNQTNCFFDGVLAQTDSLPNISLWKVTKVPCAEHTITTCVCCCQQQ